MEKNKHSKDLLKKKKNLSLDFGYRHPFLPKNIEKVNMIFSQIHLSLLHLALTELFFYYSFLFPTSTPVGSPAIVLCYLLYWMRRTLSKIIPKPG